MRQIYQSAVHFIPLMFGICGGCQTFPHAQSPSEPPAPAIVSIRDNFEYAEPSDAWTFRTPELWRIAIEDGKQFLQMAFPPPRPMMPGIRRPQEYAVYNKYEWRSFSLSCFVRVDRDVTVKGRDACIIFGRQDETHMYYAHLAAESSGGHNTIMRVDGETRISLMPQNRDLPPAMPDKAWHKVDILRDADTGNIKVLIDAYDAKHPPLFDIVDKTYEWGQIALGSFDDHASFARVMIEGEGRLLPKPSSTAPSP